MTTSAVSVPLNPFADQIVTSPRRAEPSVKGLNDQVLRRLVSEFDKVDATPRRCGRVQLVVSPAGGYGKSHLTGRLFRELGRRATRVYVRPFSAPETCWISLLHSIVQELTGPEFEDGTDHGMFPPTQLDALAHGVFGTLLIGMMDAGEFTYSEPNFVRHRLSKQIFEKWDLSSPQSAWGAWAAESLDAFEKSEVRLPRLLRLLEDLLQHSLSTTTRPHAWLRALRSYSQDRADGATRDLSLEWIRARTPRAPEATEPLGLVVADGDDQAASASVRNAIARSRVLDLLALAKLFRPFVLCFDQTEVFGRVPGLARAFGSLLSDLVQGEGAHLTVVTANNDVWESKLLPEIDAADHDRVAPRVEMLGLTRDQGRELALQRLKQTRLPSDLQEQVIAPDWLDAQFSGGLLSPREFLRRCERRYEEIVPAAPAQAAKPEMMLVELYAREHKRLLDDQRELADYRAEVLRWAILEVPSHVSTGVSVIPYRDGPASFVAEWRSPDAKRWLFVIEDGSHALNWRTIASRAVDLHKNDAGITTVALRIAGQPAVPQPHWGMVGPEIEEAERIKALQIVTLTPDQLARIYAGWELYTQACQGDIPHEPDSVVRFAAQRFHSWYASLRGAKTMGEMLDASASAEILTPLSGTASQEASSAATETASGLAPSPEPAVATASTSTSSEAAPVPATTPVKVAIPAPDVAPIKQPVPPPNIAPIKQPVPAPTGGAIKQPIPAPTGGAIKQPISAPTGAPAKQPVPAPTGGAIKQPVPAPAGGPIKPPIPPPNVAPIKAPIPPPNIAAPRISSPEDDAEARSRRGTGE